MPSAVHANRTPKPGRQLDLPDDDRAIESDPVWQPPRALLQSTKESTPYGHCLRLVGARLTGYDFVRTTRARAVQAEVFYWDPPNEKAASV